MNRTEWTNEYQKYRELRRDVGLCKSEVGRDLLIDAMVDIKRNLFYGRYQGEDFYTWWILKGRNDMDTHETRIRSIKSWRTNLKGI
jgi:hypothetical protein